MTAIEARSGIYDTEAHRDISRAHPEIARRLRPLLLPQAEAECPSGHRLRVPRDLLEAGREIFCPTCRKAFRPGGAATTRGSTTRIFPDGGTVAAVSSTGSAREGLAQIVAGLDIIARASRSCADRGLQRIADLLRVERMPAWLFRPVRLRCPASRELSLAVLRRLFARAGWAASLVLHALALWVILALGLRPRGDAPEPQATILVVPEAAPRPEAFRLPSRRRVFRLIEVKGGSHEAPEVRLPAVERHRLSSEERPGRERLWARSRAPEVTGLPAIGVISETLAIPEKGSLRRFDSPRKAPTGNEAGPKDVPRPLSRPPDEGAKTPGPPGAPSPPLPALRAGELRLWAVSTMTRVTPTWKPLPGARPRPLEIVAARNGAFCGQVVVRTERETAGLRARVTDLKREGAEEGEAGIPASAVRVSYAQMSSLKVGLWHKASSKRVAHALGTRPAFRRDQGSVLPVWLKVRVPRGARRGDYYGRLTLAAGNRALGSLPVCVKVTGWTLPDPKDYVTHVGLIQSPDSVALAYKIRPWSEAHWKLVEKSLRLAGEAGCKTIYLPLICRTNLGNEGGMVRWVPSGAAYKYDFKIFDRYLDLCQKHMKPDVVCLYVWDLYAKDESPRARHRWNRSGAPTGPKVSGMGGAVITGPKFGTVAAKNFWRPAIKEVKACLEKRGLLKYAMLGMTPDVGRWGNYQNARRTFAAVAPDLGWINNSHLDFGRYGKRRDSPFHYYTMVYAKMKPVLRRWDARRECGWNMSVKCDRFYRDYSTPSQRALKAQSLAEQRSIAEWALLSHQSGPGRIGLDFWQVLGGRRRGMGQTHTSNSISARFPESSWYQLNLQRCCEALLARGPSGAIPTVSYEMVREGVQECEARILVEKALVDGRKRARLGARLAAECEKLLDDRAKRIWCGTKQQPEYLNPEDYRKKRAELARARRQRGRMAARTPAVPKVTREQNWHNVLVKGHNEYLEELFSAAARVSRRLRGGTRR